MRKRNRQTTGKGTLEKEHGDAKIEERRKMTPFSNFKEGRELTPIVQQHIQRYHFIVVAGHSKHQAIHAPRIQVAARTHEAVPRLLITFACTAQHPQVRTRT